MKWFVVLALCNVLQAASCTSDVLRITDAATANPIRKVVSLLQSMASKVEAQVETEKELHDKFMCTCKTAIPDMEKSVAGNTAKGPAVQSELDGARSELARLKEELVADSATAADAKKALDEAGGVRKSENKAFEAETTEKKQFIASIVKSLPALTGAQAEKRSLLQTNNLLQTDLELQAILRRATAADSKLTGYDSDSITAFLATGHLSGEQSLPEIAGILQNMQFDYEKDLADLTAAENQAASIYVELVAAKTLQLKTVRQIVQKKTSRRGDLSLSSVTLKHDKKDADDMLAADSQMLQHLQTDCKTESATYATRSASRGEELRAISETVHILSNDDALDVFKATLPSPSAAAFLQTKRTGTIQARLQDARAAAAVLGSNSQDSLPETRFLQLSLLSKKVDFTKVNKMVDDMIALLKREQTNDDTIIENCKAQFHKTQRKKKELGASIREQEASKDERMEALQVVTDDLKELHQSVLSLDNLVTDTTKERQEQNSDFTGTMVSNTAAKEILEFAKQRLSAFYNTDDSSKGLSLAAQKSSVNVAMPASELFRVLDARTPTMPVSLIQNNNNQEVLGGVTDMLNKLITDVNEQMAEAKHDEEHSQKVYETTLVDASSKRATYVKSIQVKEAAKAENEISKTREGGDLAATYKESKATKAYDLQMHKECDWIMQNSEFRNKARAEEAENLSKAKAVLHGSSYALVQTHSLRGKNA